MFTCVMCHFSTELDDVVIEQRAGRCMCVRCYHRQTSSTLPMPIALWHAVTSTLASIDAK